MNECLSPDIYSSYDENHLKELYRIHDGEPGYPDYYLRNSITNAVVLFECKDIRLNSYIKEQRDYDLIEEELRNKIVEKTYQLDAENKCRKKVGPRRIGIGQLAAHVANIKRSTFPWDTTLPPDCSVYPVLVIADNRLLFDGLPYLAQQWYQERLAIEGTIPKSSRPLIMMSPLTLLKYRPLFKENGFEFYFEEYYASLQSVSGDDIMGTINGMISFDSFMGQYPYSLEELREEIMTTLFTPDEQNVLR